MNTPFTCGIAGRVLSGLLFATSAMAATRDVGDYAALTNAIAVCADGDTISVTNSITVSAQVSVSAKSLTLEGNQHTISVPVPSLDASGCVTTNASAFRVFNINAVGKFNTLRNLTVKGGCPVGEGGGILNGGGTLVLEGVTVTRSGGSGYGGGGVANDTGTLFMRDCTINRNTAKNGGGFFNISTGAKMFIERCTLSDNRCMSGAGGGAGENKALLYVNNSTFANNACNELGGAINNYVGTAYFVGCTFVGNMAYGGTTGGAIVNHSGTVTLVNSLFAYNYHNNGGTYVLDDINNYSGTAPVAYGCVFHSTTDQLGVGSVGTHLYTGNATGSDDTLFAGGAEAKVLAADGTETGAGTFYQPFLWKGGADQTLTTPMKGGGFAVGKGVRAAFSSATATPVVGYYNGSAWVALSGSNPAGYEVTTDQHGVDRAGSLIVGAAVSNVSGLCRLKVTAADRGTVSGGTIYGDTYPLNTTVTLTATPGTGYKFNAWNYVLGGSGVASSANPFPFTLTTNVTLHPVFAPSAPVIGAPPTNQVLAIGGTIALSVAAVSVGPQNFQWFKNGGMLPGATNSTLTRSNAAVTDSGVYYVAITNAYGLSISTPVMVTVGTPQLLAWGSNSSGQLGDGTKTTRLAPVLAAGSVVAAAAGYAHSLFVKGDGTLWATGYNYYGELGDGTTTGSSNAVFVASNVTAVAAGYAHSLFLTGDGTLWAMGQNNYGQLGDGTGVDRHSPVPVSSHVVALSAGSEFSTYLTGDGTLWAMGRNNYGQLGDGTVVDRHSPVPVVGMRLARVVSGSMAFHTLALGEPLPLTITQQPLSQTVGVGSNVTFTVAADGFAPLSYQWYFNDDPISGATAANFTQAGVTAANAGSYMAVVSNPGGCVTSGVAVLTFVKGLASVTLETLIQTYDGAPKSVTALTVPSGLTVLMTYNGFATAPTAVGTYAVTGTVSDLNWQGSASGTLIVKASQSIHFTAITPQPVAGAVGLVATASSGLPVSFGVLSGPGSIADGTNLTFSAAGIVVVVASQAGDAIYGAAPEVTNRVSVYEVIPDSGPLAGGNTVTISIGALGTVTGVRVGGVAAALLGADANGLTLTMPANGSAGAKDILIQTSEAGDFTLSNAYMVNPAGWIGGSRLEPSGWEGFGSGLSGSSVSALAVDGTNLYTGGDFTSAGGAAANRVALWNGTSWTNLGSGLSGTAVYALALDGANLYAGGDFTNAGGVAANSVAMWNGTVWTGLGSGLSGTVRALAHDGVNLYAGGTFTNAGGVAANYVALWDGTSWTALGSGVDSWVRALAHDGTNLYAGGYFTTAGGVAANHVARWDGTSWEALGSGLNNDVRALTLVGTNLVAGGDFTSAGDGAANAVALWDGTGWTALGSGMNDSVTALAYDGVNLVAGGYFTEAGGVGANYVAQWNGEEWTALGSGMNGVVKALAHDGTDLYAGGDFTTAGGVPAGRAAVWGEMLVGLSGVAPGSGAQSGGYTVTISGANLCDGSDVTGVTLRGVAASLQSQSATQIVVTAGAAGATGPGDVRVFSTRFGETVRSNAFTYLANQTVSFAALAPQPLAAQVGLAATASSGLPVSFRVVSGPGMIADSTNLTFSAAGLVTIAASQAGDALYGAAPDVVNSVTAYSVVPDNGPFAGGNTVALNIGTLGTVTGVRVAGASAEVQGIDASGLTLAMPATGSAGVKEIVVQTSDHGDFTLADAYTVNPAGQIGGSMPGPNVWTGLGDGLPGSAVYALAHAGTNLFAGGTFTLAGVANDALWDGIDWAGLGGGMDDTVTALAYDGANLYAGGYFTTAGGVAANYVAMWDGTVWTSLGSGLDGPVSALVCNGGNLYAGGAFTTAGGVSANRVAKWNGTYWTGLGSGVEGSLVTALAHDGMNLVAGGDFTKAGGVAANRVALWNGSAWSSLGSGLNGTVFALERDGTGLVAGGAFTSAGGVPANRVARWNGTSWSALGSGMNDTVRALAHDGSNLYAGGYFTAAGGMAANYVALWDGAGWASLDSGVNSWVRSLAHDGKGLVAGGYFTAAGGEAANHVARWAPSVITYANVTPDSGTLSGGYQVVISGANLCSGSDVTSVTLCGVSAAVQSQSATQIVVTAGAALSFGPGDVRVFSTRFGETVKADAFTYLDLPVWNPQVQSGESFGVRSNLFGFTVSGSSNLIVVVEACTNLAAPVWTPVETNTLTEGLFYFSDPDWTNYPARFYRLRQP